MIEILIRKDGGMRFRDARLQSFHCNCSSDTYTSTIHVLLNKSVVYFVLKQFECIKCQPVNAVMYSCLWRNDLTCNFLGNTCKAAFE